MNSHEIRKLAEAAVSHLQKIAKGSPVPGVLPDPAELNILERRRDAKARTALKKKRVRTKPISGSTL